MIFLHRLQKILRSIQEHCATNRRRVTEFFQDFDKLRSGRISPYQFRRCLHMLGMVNLLSELDYELLFEHFRSAKCVCVAPYPCVPTHIFLPEANMHDPCRNVSNLHQ